MAEGFCFLVEQIEIGKVSQGVQPSVLVIGLMNHSILIVFSSQLSKQPFQIAAVIRISKNNDGLGLGRTSLERVAVLDIATSQQQTTESRRDI